MLPRSCLDPFQGLDENLSGTIVELGVEILGLPAQSIYDNPIRIGFHHVVSTTRSIFCPNFSISCRALWGSQMKSH
ncbi:hypothetical protein DBT_0003 [Dissulfuribacter thermophilus]|uniref:Uncharacterized protein n=1 Tax=Dissulfuribacter thermophilus TaxID=1156395 RepID=A0A1B9F8E1_9BACT|nr:hypothetical protein DBT_0003 [Dissulfuribacter thermophilus]